MIKFRQIIKPGNSGRDVRAVKRTMIRMRVPDSGAMSKSNFAGNSFVKCIRHVQRQNNIKVDGIYGSLTHKHIAPHFLAYDKILYKRAKIRKHKTSTPTGDAQHNAQRLMGFYSRGKLHADNPAEYPQIKAMAEGHAIWSPGGYWTHIDNRVLEALIYLIEKGFRIGTFAMCSDHPYDGTRHGHSGGHAVDISSINGVSVASGSIEAKINTLKVAEILHSDMPSTLKPWQLICDGYGYMHDPQISALTIPGYAYYGYPTMSGHRNHIHLGYWGD